MRQEKIIIWSADNYNALGLLRQLGGEFDEIYFINTGRRVGIASASKFCYHYKELSVEVSSIEELIKLNKDCPKGILIPCGDAIAEFIDSCAELLKPYYHLMGTFVSGKLKEIDNKNLMCKLAQKHGFIVPKSIKYIKGERGIDKTLFPAVLKPVRCKNGLHEFKYKKIKNIKKLVAFDKYLTPENEYILQEFIPKDNDILVYGVRLKNGDVELAGQYIKDRWSDDGGGSHGFLTAELPTYINTNGIISALKEIDYYGLFSVEFGLKDNKAWFYEFNLRNDATSHLFYQSGANLPLKWCYDCLGLTAYVPTRIKDKHENINELYDITNVFCGKISLSRYIKEYKRADVFHFRDIDDPKPYFNAKKTAIWDVPFRFILRPIRPYLVFLINKLK